MATMKKFLFDTLRSVAVYKAKIIVISIWPILLIAFFGLINSLSKYFEDPTGVIGLVLSLICLALVITNIGVYFIFKPKLKFKDTEGCWIDEKTNIRYCPTCQVKHKQLVPMKRLGNNWRCSVGDCPSISKGGLF